MRIDILGTYYEVVMKDYKDDSAFEERSLVGYSDSVEKEIVICNLSTYPGLEGDTPERHKKMIRNILRHEIIHSFLSESGLEDSSCTIENPWARNEEMVDWMALQLPKIIRACEAADAL